MKSLEGYDYLRLDDGKTRVLVATDWRERFLDLERGDPDTLFRGVEIAGRTTGGRAPHAIVRVGDESWVV